MSLPNDKFILTPHNGANSADAYDAMTQMAIESVVDVLEGRNPKHQVNKKSVGYFGINGLLFSNNATNPND